MRRSILFDAQADILTYGMGERASVEILARLASGTPVEEITDVRGTCVAARHPGVCAYPKVEVPSFEGSGRRQGRLCPGQHDRVSGA